MADRRGKEGPISDGSARPGGKPTGAQAGDPCEAPLTDRRGASTVSGAVAMTRDEPSRPGTSSHTRICCNVFKGR
jgi:hypothetical protein